jgi:hypothetical protein
VLPTLRRTDGERGGRGDLIQALRGNPNKHWITLSANDSTPAGQKAIEMMRVYESGTNVPDTYKRLRSQVAARTEAIGGTLNPDWCEWFMNWPIGWTSVKELSRDEVEYWKAASSTDVHGSRLQEMWFNRESGAPSQGPGSDEQRSVKRGGALFALPPRRTQEDSKDRVRGVRNNVSTEAISESEAVREFAMQQNSREEILRLAVGVVNRVDRIRALGNGQVPAVVAGAWETLRR